VEDPVAPVVSKGPISSTHILKAENNSVVSRLASRWASLLITSMQNEPLLIVLV
jgi:hypothetical protein